MTCSLSSESPKNKMSLFSSILDVLKDLPVNHIIYTVSAVFIILLLLIYAELNNKSELNKIDKFLAIFPLIFEANFQIISLWNHQWYITKSLPLEFSYITSLSICFYTINHYNKLDTWIFFSGLWCVTAAFLNTILTGYETWHISLRYYSHHALLLYFGIRCLRRGYRPTYIDYLSAIRNTGLIIIAISTVNYLLGSNYMFTKYRPEGANFSRLMPDWPFYFLLIISIGLFFYTVLYLITKRNKISD